MTLADLTAADWNDQVIRSMTEKAWTAHVRALATTCGWMVSHSWLSVHSPSGFPDLVLVRPQPDGAGRVIFAELKTERGTLRGTQFQWLEALAACPGVETYIWRPSDRDHVLDVLRGDLRP